MPFCPSCRADYAPGLLECHDCGVDLVDSLESPVELRLVTVASFDTPVRANIFASRLEAEGIEVFLEDEAIVGAHALLAGAVGGVKLQVRPADAVRAERSLEQLRRDGAFAAAIERPACPLCSARAEPSRLPAAALILSILLLGVPFLFLRRSWTCPACAHRWP
jgi:hypothetical protein